MTRKYYIVKNDFFFFGHTINEGAIFVQNSGNFYTLYEYRSMLVDNGKPVYEMHKTEEVIIHKAFIEQSKLLVEVKSITGLIVFDGKHGKENNHGE